MKKLLSFGIAFMMLFSAFSTSAYATDSNSEMYYDIINESSQFNDDCEISIDFAEEGLISDTGYSKTRANNTAVVVDYLGFNVSYVFSQQVRGYARTKVSSTSLLNPPSWKAFAGGSLYKNGYYLYGAPTTSTSGSSPDIRSNSPYDYNPKSGDEYKFNSYHTVHDSSGTVVWNTAHYRTTTY